MADEKLFENKIKKYLKDRGCYFFKYWGGGQFTKAGVPDIIACVNGYFIGIEVKGPRGRPSPLQIHNLRQIDVAGGFAVLIYPDNWELFKNFIDCLFKDYQNATCNYVLLKGVWETWEHQYKLL